MWGLRCQPGYRGRGKGGHPSYGCPRNFYRGACANQLKERADWLEDRLLSKLQEAVIQPDAIDYALQEFERQLAESLSNLSNETSYMRQRSERIHQELRNLVSSVASCGPSPALVEAINEREQELQAIASRLLTNEEGSVSTQVSKMRQFVTERLGDIRQLLYADVRRAKAELAKHISGIQMQPQRSVKKGHYIAKGEWNLLGGFSDAPSLCPTEMRVRIGCGGWI